MYVRRPPKSMVLLGPSRGRAVERDVLTAACAKELPEPAAPAIFQPKPGQPRHQVQFRRPAVAQPDRIEARPCFGDDHVLRHDLLTDRVMAGEIDPNALHFHFHRLEPLPPIEPGQIGPESLDHEPALRLEMRGDAGETPQLVLLGEKGEKRVEGDEDQGETTVDLQVREVAHRDRDRPPTWLGAERLYHCPRRVAPLNPDAA